MHYLSTKDLGFNKDQVVVLQLANTGLEEKGKELMKCIKTKSKYSFCFIKQSCAGAKQ
jgi:hypothetical protein